MLTFDVSHMTENICAVPYFSMHAFSKLYHADFVCPSKGQTSVVLSSTFLPQSSSKRLFHDTSGGTFRIIIAYQESITASFEDIWQRKLSQNVRRR